MKTLKKQCNYYNDNYHTYGPCQEKTWRSICIRRLKEQTGLHIRAVWSVFVVHPLESITDKLASRKISIFQLISVTMQVGLSLACSEIPKQVFSRWGQENFYELVSFPSNWHFVLLIIPIGELSIIKTFLVYIYEHRGHVLLYFIPLPIYKFCMFQFSPRLFGSPRRGTEKSPLGQKPTRIKAHWTISHLTKAHC